MVSSRCGDLPVLLEHLLNVQRTRRRPFAASGGYMSWSSPSWCMWSTLSKFPSTSPT